ncbi:lachrymatory-factor synthase-like [Nicotiana tabacum]|uniref:Lachrymatory-factor synthase-like n=2 Tax=Nicotiana TaxID=4085 RepID=A0A1S4AY05_TOBAC|nr:PREDICTED: lachrymatory-factor synthase [Nicotiana sylvestris]XP_016481562.1 PREDICTED: lachrymatory-factor synthase-like [Nicotiana tabacum]
MEQKDSQPKWEINVSTKLQKAISADQIFSLFKDFFGLNKWFSSLPTCYGIYGENGEVGCIRYCAGFSLPPESGGAAGGEAPVSWSKERLVAINPIERTLSYEIVDCNIGFKSYFSTVRIVPDEVDGQNGCVIEWFITVDPVERMRLEDLVKKYEVGLQRMAKKIEYTLASS